MLFLGGVGSGGTDLLMNIVNAHPAIFVVGEMPFLPGLAARTGASVPAGQLDAVATEMRRLDEYNTFGHHHWTNWINDSKENVPLGPPPEPVNGELTVAAIFRWMLGTPADIVWTGNKTPTNTENIDRLTRLFPDARFIVVVRDPRDVAVSWRRRWGRDERLTADKWETRLAAGRRHLRDLPGDRALILHFEDLLTDLDASCREICDFLALDFDPRMLRFHETVTKTIGGQENRGRPVLTGNREKWRTALRKDQVRRVEEIAWEGMRIHGYEPQHATGPRPLSRVERLRGRARDIWAVLFVGSRFQKTNRRRDRIHRILLQAKKHLLHRDVYR